MTRRRPPRGASYWALRAAAGHRWGSADLAGRRVTVLGVGKVGRALVDHLVAAGAPWSPWPTSRPPRGRRRDRPPIPRSSRSTPPTALTTEADALAPCALGGLLDAVEHPRARRRDRVRGGQQPAGHPRGRGPAGRGRRAVRPRLRGQRRRGHQHRRRGRPGGYDRDRAFARVAGIGETVTDVLDRAAADGITPEAAAHDLVDQRLAAARPDPILAPFRRSIRVQAPRSTARTDETGASGSRSARAADLRSARWTFPSCRRSSRCWPRRSTPCPTPRT